MLDFNPTNATIMSLFVSALVLVLRIAEKRMDKSRNGPLYPRVRHLEGRFNELDVKIDDISREDLPDRVERIEADLRRIARENAK